MLYHPSSVPSGPPEFLISPQPQWVNNGSQFSLDCVAMGDPPPNITWWRNGRPISALGAEFVQTVNNSLVVFPAVPDTVGYFTCVADNGLKRSTSSAQVDLLFPVESSEYVCVCALFMCMYVYVCGCSVYINKFVCV